MELRQLRYFIGVAESLNFSEAARNLYVTQSTLSQQIKALEDELGTTLFQRDSHSVELTETGARLLPLAQRTVQDAESCKSQIQDMQDLRQLIQQKKSRKQKTLALKFQHSAFQFPAQLQKKQSHTRS